LITWLTKTLYEAFQEGIDEFGSQRALRRAQLSGDAPPYDPVRGTTVEEFASGDQGSFVFGYMYDEIDKVSQLLSQEPDKIGEAFGRMMNLGAVSQRVAALGNDAQYFTLRFGDVNKALSVFSPVRSGSARAASNSSDTALGKLYMAMGYVQAEKDGVTYRQYGDGTVKQSKAKVGADPDTAKAAGFVEVDPEDVPTGLFRPAPTNPNTASFDGFDTTREDLPVSLSDVQAELEGTKSLAQQNMGANDVLFGQLAASSLNQAMAIPDPRNRVKRLYSFATFMDQLPTELSGDRGKTLAQTMELRSAQGNLQGLFDDVDKIIDAGNDQLIIDKEFADYMQKYGTIARGQTSEQRVDDAGNVFDVRTTVEVQSEEPLTSANETVGQAVSAAFGELKDVGRGVIEQGAPVIDVAARPGAERVGPVGVSIPVYSSTDPYDLLEKTARFETQEEIERARRELESREIDAGRRGLEDEMLPSAMRRKRKFQKLEADAAASEAALEELLQLTRDMEEAARKQGMQYRPMEAIPEEQRNRMKYLKTLIERIDKAPAYAIARPVLTAEQRRALEDQIAISDLPDSQVSKDPKVTPTLGAEFLDDIRRAMDPGMFRELEGALQTMQRKDISPSERQSISDKATQILKQQIDLVQDERQYFEKERLQLEEQPVSRRFKMLEHQVRLMRLKIEADPYAAGYNPRNLDHNFAWLQSKAEGRLLRTAQEKGYNVESFDDMVLMAQEADRLESDRSKREVSEYIQDLSNVEALFRNLYEGVSGSLKEANITPAGLEQDQDVNN